MAKALAPLVLAAACIIGASPPAFAVQIDDFQGPYAIANWTLDDPNGGSVVDDGLMPPTEIVITEPAILPSEISFTIPSAGDGTFEFHWSVDNADGGYLEVFAGDSFGGTIDCSDSSCTNTLVGAQLDILICIAGLGCSGTIVIPVETGDKIGWAAANTDAGDTVAWTINAFSAPVPIPAALPLFGFALAALGVLFVRRRKEGPA